uniref:Uncharacterized protein n=1 Tax=Arion vulgaris TaxID=1028688 RepID=A0A0B6ZZL7_9EUPU
MGTMPGKYLADFDEVTVRGIISDSKLGKMSGECLADFEVGATVSDVISGSKMGKLSEENVTVFEVMANV